MAVIDVINQNGEVVGTYDLNDTVFGIEPHKDALYEAVKLQRASLRQGTSAVKRRSDVRGGGRKPYRQKGTGRARQGSIRAPQYRGGGVVFGPNPRDYSYKINKKVRRLALKSALSSKLQDSEMALMNEIVLDSPKTKGFAAILNAIEAPAKTLFVLGKEEGNENVELSARNIPTVSMMSSDGINVYDLLNANKVVFTEAAVKEIEEALA
ncbi:50S ribosomal protein L4 [Ileibacterium valens]|uniref:Large ribosomal subunit protein uL4 n=1 Tax=Ileibacterium valens TaxID=1862668 RepID=A0A1U7NGK9_9FIRM|nr:50S ribosomal protein L4 [Ileibacterium valens]OLU38771.1 50S ribosomal protein L4 [Erysipelotrichaceae bacterium NYU-BL-F16]OLU39184.1 50S ribosomal protein L4 [Erysipelotrichaceae bacterium NYU-BL-E8]OLU40315.1 50S ribosomal protein L4 [Ileibacterium valens]